MSRKLTFVKHSRPEKQEGVDSHQWPLSAQGRADTERLAGLLKGARYQAAVTSDEPKASETAHLLAEVLGVRLAVSEGLREHDRSNVPMMKTPEFVSAIANFFRRPNQLVLGAETAKAACKRFERAVNGVLDENPEPGDAEAPRDLLIVTHGTVLALWLETYCDLDGYTAWRQLGLPSFVTVSWPDCAIVRRVDQLPVG